MTRDALILAAGRGTRLAAENQGRPKCMATVAGRSILDHQFRCLKAVGVQRIVLVTGYEMPVLRDYAQNLAAEHCMNVEFVHNSSYATTNVLTSWRLAAPSLTRDYYYLHGDTLVEPELLHRLRSASASDALTVAIDRHECGDEEMKVILDGAVVTRLSKELNPVDVDGEFTGVLHCPAGVRDTLEWAADQVLASECGSRAFFEAALQYAIDHNRLIVRAIDITGLRWREIDFPEDLMAARSLFAEA